VAVTFVGVCSVGLQSLVFSESVVLACRRSSRATRPALLTDTVFSMFFGFGSQYLGTGASDQFRIIITIYVGVGRAILQRFVSCSLDIDLRQRYRLGR